MKNFISTRHTTGRFFSEESNRNLKVNRYLAIVCSIAAFLGMRILLLAGSPVLDRFPALKAVFIIWSLVVIALDMWAAYFDSSNTGRSKYIIVYSYAAYYVAISLCSTNDALTMLVYCTVFVYMLYFNRKNTIKLALSIAAVIVIKDALYLYPMKGFLTVSNREVYFQIMLALMLSAAIILASFLLEMFTRDIFGKAEDEKQKIAQMLSEIMAISSEVKKETQEVGNIVSGLASSSLMVKEAISDIATAAESNTFSIESQTQMTQSINGAIEDTFEKSENVVSIAKEVKKEVDSGVLGMEKLKQGTENISETNSVVVEKMEELLSKMKNMKEFSDLILRISGKTNLLALNASIESARAGEAGRGFAVVAEEIRVLSEQTKNATASINELIDELAQVTDIVSESINSSVEAAKLQSEVIVDLHGKFVSTGENMGELSSHVSDISSMIASLKDSNAAIIDSITQISASGQEMMANTENVTAIATGNEEDANKAKLKLDLVLDKSKELDKYSL